jgi:hypothetical protein
MPRLLSPAMVAALGAQILRPALLVSMQFASSTIYLWSGLGPVTWNSMTFTGVGTLGKISTISEGSTVEAQNVTISLSGISPDTMSEVLTETRILGKVKVWLALFDSNLTLIPDPVQSYIGNMDTPSLSDDGKSCTCEITVENVLVDLNRAVARRYTSQDALIDLPATLARLGLPSTTRDTGYQYVPPIQSETIYWGVTPSSTNNV